MMYSVNENATIEGDLAPLISFGTVWGVIITLILLLWVSWKASEITSPEYVKDYEHAEYERVSLALVPPATVAGVIFAWVVAVSSLPYIEKDIVLGIFVIVVGIFAIEAFTVTRFHRKYAKGLRWKDEHSKLYILFGLVFIVTSIVFSYWLFYLAQGDESEVTHTDTYPLVHEDGNPHAESGWITYTEDGYGHVTVDFFYDDGTETVFLKAPDEDTVVSSSNDTDENMVTITEHCFEYHYSHMEGTYQSCSNPKYDIELVEQAS